MPCLRACLSDVQAAQAGTQTGNAQAGLILNENPHKSTES